MEYQLLAMDMDGTVLNSEKIITPRTDKAIRAALQAGKQVLFATGRCPGEVRGHLAAYPEMRYLLALSGALVLDVRTGQALADVTLSRELTGQVMELVSGVDAMLTLFAGEDVYVEHRHRGRMDYFGCECFARLYEQCAVWVDSIPRVLQGALGGKVHKLNIFCHTQQDWEQVHRLLSPLPVTMARGIPNNYEVSPLGVDKGAGLEMLCRAAGIPVEQAIAVGDEGNDAAMLRAAGLGVAMGNAPEHIRALADAVTADCDHDGVAQVIETYLLG